MTRAEENVNNVSDYVTLFVGEECAPTRYLQPDYVLEAMKQHAIEFANWITENVTFEQFESMTTDELYDKFNNK